MILFEFVAAGWSAAVTMETSAPLIEMDSAVIDKGTEEKLVSFSLITGSARTAQTSVKTGAAT